MNAPRELAAVTAVTPAGVTPPRRGPDAGAIDRLLEAPQRFEFHQAVRLLQRWLDDQPDDDRAVLRFRNSLALSFPASEIASLETESREASTSLSRLSLTPAFMGLLGANGALPLAYSEQFAAHEASERDDAARAFLDIFQHRAVSLFHEAWRKHRLPLQFERDRRERYLPLVLSLAGLGEAALRGRLGPREGGVADDALAYYAGLLQRRAVSAHHLQRVLADYFGVPVQVTQFVGRWFELEADSQLSLSDDAAQCLGRDTVLGARVWQRDLRVRLTFGPMGRAQHARFLPGGPAAHALKQLLALVSGAALEYEVRLVLRAADVRAAVLGAGDAADAASGSPRDVAPANAGACLGWNAFLFSGHESTDRDEAAYDLHALAA